MRNSFLPLVGVIVVAVLAILAIPRDREMGHDGPQLAAGILRLPKNPGKMVAAAPLQADNTVTLLDPGQRVPGLEPDAWRVVAVVAGDDRALTRATVLGLAERLTEQGSVAIIALATKAPLPLPADRVLTITTTEELLPSVAGGACSGTITIRQGPVMLPASHPAAGLQGATGVTRSELLIAHRSTSPGAPPRWASWFAAVGRSLGDQAITALAGSAGLPSEWDRARPPPTRPDAGTWTMRNPQALLFLLVVPVFLIIRHLLMRRLPSHHRQRTYRLRWVRPTVISLALVVGALWTAKPVKLTAAEVATDDLTTWTTHLPIAPSMEVLRWRGCFADDLVRGWVGRIDGTMARTRTGAAIPADQPVREWLGKYDVDQRHTAEDRWREDTAPAPTQRVWRRTKDGAEEFFLLAQDERGFDCVLWQEQSRGASVHARWLEAAGDPALSRAARRMLRRHLLSRRIPDDQRAEAAVRLRDDPDAAEVAMLAELPDASAGERAFAQAARYAYGREPIPPASTQPTWSQLARNASVTLDGRPTLLQAGETFVLVLSRPAGGGEVVARSPAGHARCAIAADGSASLALSDGSTLALAAGNLVTWR